MSSLSDSTLRKKIGQLFAVGFHGLTPSSEIKTLIREYGLGAIVLFKRNIQDAAQLQVLFLSTFYLTPIEEAKNAGHEHPLFIGIDQENGLVTRITPPIAAQQPGQMALGATQSIENAYEVGKSTGEMLSFFGVNMNYAPDCDINSEPLNPVIGVRSPGDDPSLVGRISLATASGLRDSGVVPTVKHFPGHGDTAVDSHHGLPVIAKSRSELERCELIPFRRAVAHGIEAVMTAHIALPKINSSLELKGLPATLSADALGILRNDMKYDGVIITDCLEMDGIRATYGTVEGSLMSLKAGSDSVMICHTYDVQVKSIERVMQAVKFGDLSQSRIDEAFRRVKALKQKFLTWEHALRTTTADLSLTNLATMNERHENCAKKVYSKSTTVVRNDLNTLPISPGTSKVLLLTPGGRVPVGGAVDESGSKHRTYLDVLKENTGDKTSSSVTEILYPDTGFLSDEHWQVIKEEADIVILATRNAKEAKEQRKLALQLVKTRHDLIVIAACNPYDFLDDVDLFKTYIAIYEPTVEAFASAVDIIYGKATSKGKLPVASKSDLKPNDNYEIKAYNPSEKDAMIEGITKVWKAALPDYKLQKEDLAKVIDQSHGQHFIAQEKRENGGTIVGFILAYKAVKRGKQSAHIAALAVDPAKQGKGIGSKLLADAREYLYEQHGIKNVPLRSYFPRFWPGLPADLPRATRQFFVNRGYRLTDSNGGSIARLDVKLSADLYQDIRNFKSPQRYLERAAAAKVTYKAITPETFADCLSGQKRNFTHYTGWVETYIALNPEDHPFGIMAAFDENHGSQIGWTLMLSPEDDYVARNWAFPPLAGGGKHLLKTGVIGCVGVDEAHRGRGVGLAMLCHAIEDMRRRGVEAVFIDSTNKVDWYAKVGFSKWKEYFVAEI
ncbi:hypothetical protein UA08_01313 [Talaromyces atroroseus]|uniref:N-acetyltransferase domain-containing protein n=1 Tax=Talaromyces atroroseus TaxID=1441469 RepID=A0A1Q5QBC5_TALAT|nr:hypothetical protein UA08_01313 [Talaromyces atroroseus]OKL63216.1 hypothetical protein UA08_01313 [Talaromyces atroroseus]